MDVEALIARLKRNVLRGGATPTLGIIEMLGATDSRLMRQRWIKWKFKDVTPLWGDKTVKTFRGTWKGKVFKNEIKTIKQWPAFNKAFEAVDADWYYISGHHGRQYAFDWTEDMNTEPFVGFFNEFYHEHRWVDATKSQPLDGIHEHGVYMKSTVTPIVYPVAGGGLLAEANPHGPESNPVFLKSRKSCKGALLIACNTLSYRHSRLAWQAIMPNAVVIGKTRTCAGGKESWEPLRKVLTKAFFLDPASYFKNVQSPRELCEKLNRHYRRRIGYGVMWDGKLYHKPDRKLPVQENAVADNL